MDQQSLSPEIMPRVMQPLRQTLENRFSNHAAKRLSFYRFLLVGFCWANRFQTSAKKISTAAVLISITPGVPTLPVKTRPGRRLSKTRGRVHYGRRLKPGSALGFNSPGF
jgi:hypothetical protein